MQVYVCIAILAVAAVAAVQAHGPGHSAFEKEMDASIAACQVSEKASAADAAMYKKHQVPTTQEGKCMVGCVQEKMGILTNGAFIRTIADQLASSKEGSNPGLLTAIKNAHMACEEEVGTSTDKCVTGPKLMECMEKHMPRKH